MGAVHYVQQGDKQLNQLANQFKAKRHEIAQRVAQLSDKNRHLEKQIERLNQKLASLHANSLTDNLKDIHGQKVLIATVNGMDNKTLRTLSDDMKSKLADGIVILASVYTADGEDKIAMTASVGKHLTGKIKAGDIIKHLSENLGGKGGGKPDFAQGGATDVANLPKLMTGLTDWIGEKLG